MLINTELFSELLFPFLPAFAQLRRFPFLPLLIRSVVCAIANMFYFVRLNILLFSLWRREGKQIQSVSLTTAKVCANTSLPISMLALNKKKNE
jgi:hypothetical protein